MTKIPQLPSIPSGTITSQTSLPVSKTGTDAKSYKMSMDQVKTWLINNGISGGGSGTQGAQGAQGASGGGGGAQGAAGAQGGTGAQGAAGGGAQGSPGVQGASGFQGTNGAQGSPGVQGASGFTGTQGASGSQGLTGSSGYQGFIGPQGFTGVSGYQGFQGSMGSNTGQPGPGLVYTGAYRNTSYIYYNTTIRKDVVSTVSGSTVTYWLANSTSLTATSGASGWGTPGVDSAWSNFGENFKSVATGLLLTEDASVTKTITLGEVSNLSAGIIRSANCNNFADGYGFWLGNDPQGRTGFFVGNSAGPSYLAYDSSVGGLALSGTVYATAGKIAGIGIADYTYSGGSSGTVLYSGNPLTPGTSATPIFINGRAAGTYGNGEVILGLGNSLVYYHLSAGGGTYVARLSGEIIANAGSIGGVGLNQGYIWSGGSGGVGYFDNDNTPFWVNGNPNPTTDNYFSLGSNLVYYKVGGTPVLAVSGTITAVAGSIGGVGLNQGYIWTGGTGGSGFFANDNTPFWVNGNPDPTTDNYFSLGSNLVYYKTGGTPVLAVSGTITAVAGSIGGVGLNQGYIWTGGTGGSGFFANANTPFYLNSSDYKFSIGNKLYFDGAELTLTGTVKSGMTDYDTGTGWFLGSAGNFSVGKGGGTDNRLLFDGTKVKIWGGLYVQDSLGLRYKDNSGVFTITGGSENGVQYGSQIDFAGNSATEVSGTLSLNSGTNPNGVIRFGTGPNTNTGSTNYARMTIDYDGLVAVLSATTGADAGNMYIEKSLALGTASNGGVGDVNTSGNIKAGEYIAFGNGNQTVMSISNNFGSNNCLTFAAGSGDGSSNAFRWVSAGNGAELMNLTTTGQVNATSFNATSTRTLKTNIKPITFAINIVEQLQGVTFDWIDKPIYNDVGLIAEDVEKVLPAVVHKTPDGTVRGLDYGRITAVLIESVKELKQEITALKNQK